LAQAITRLPDDRSLFELLGDDAIHPDESLPATGVSLAWERMLSSAFVKADDDALNYGTRSSTIAWFGSDGTTVMDEQTWLPGAQRGPRSRFRVNGN
jgi:uncharacterized protein with NRDE domain